VVRLRVGSRRLRRKPALATVGLLAAITAAPAAPARALESDPEDVVTAGPAADVDVGVQPYALARVMTAGPAPPALYVLSSGGYGYTESVLGTADAHHRLTGALMVDGRPLRWLGLALRLDGRYDQHVIPGQPRDTGLVGDPRLYVRIDRALGSALAIGARAGVWLPGRNAPSLDPAALSPELLAAVSYSPGAGRLTVTANIGYRLDRSARTATDATRLGPGDRLALDISAYDGVLVGGAASVRLGRAHAFVEGSWNLLVGAGSPRPLASPIRVGGGVRFPVAERVGLEAMAEVSPSARPDLSDPMSAPVPVPPRFAVGLGLAYRFGGPTAPAGSAVLVAAPPPTPKPPPPPEAAPEPAEPAATAGVRGRITAADGSALEDVHARVTGGAQSRPIAVDEKGRFTIEGAPGDELVIAVEAKGFLPATQPVTLVAGPPAEVAIDLRRPGGQLRGVVRSFRGSTVDADISVDGDTNELRASQGRFSMDVTPGDHEVRISARGYTTQVRRVRVEQNGVTLLNIDLKRAP
jgi:hypothetical protein